MKNPIQLETRWHIDHVTLGLTNQLAMRFSVLKKESASLTDMLKALKVDVGIAEPLDQVGSGLQQRLGKRTGPKKP